MTEQIIKTGDQVRFRPTYEGTRWWTVKARDARFIIVSRRKTTSPAARAFAGDATAVPETIYSVVDLTGWTHTYNGVRPGVVRSSINLIGGGYDAEPGWEGRMLRELQAGRLELSRRRVAPVNGIEVRS